MRGAPELDDAPGVADGKSWAIWVRCRAQKLAFALCERLIFTKQALLLKYVRFQPGRVAVLPVDYSIRIYGAVGIFDAWRFWREVGYRWRRYRYWSAGRG